MATSISQYLVIGEKCFETVDIIVIEVLFIGRGILQLLHKVIGNVQGMFEGGEDFGAIAVLAMSFVHSIGETLQLFQFAVVDGGRSLHFVVVVEPVRYLQCRIKSNRLL